MSNPFSFVAPALPAGAEESTVAQQVPPNWIKAELMRRGVRQTHIADRLGVTPSAVGQVIHGRRPSPRIREAVAAALGLTVEELWPDSAPLQKCTTHRKVSNG